MTSSSSLSTKLTTYLHDKGVWSVKPYQLEGIKWLLKHKRCVLADEQGLGKTSQAVLAAVVTLLANEVEDVVVVCNKAVMRSWAETIRLIGIRTNSFRLVTSSYQAIAQTVTTNRTAWIIDEAHHYCNPDSKRSQVLLSATANNNYVWQLTGTPIRNGSYANLLGLLLLIRHPIVSNPITFLERYSYASTHDGETRWYGARNTEELRAKVGHLFLRRRKADVLELPPQVNVVVHLKDEAATQAFEVERAKVAWVKDAGLRKLMLRNANALTKVPTATIYLLDLVRKVGKVVVFTNVVEVVQQLQANLQAHVPTIVVYGQTPNRGELVAKYNALSKGVFIATTKTCGEGVTLTSASDLVLLDYPWTASELTQISDRIHRIGQTKPCTCHWLELTDFDAKLFELVTRKERPHTDLFEEVTRLSTTQTLYQLEPTDQLIHQQALNYLEGGGGKLCGGAL